MIPKTMQSLRWGTLLFLLVISFTAGAETADANRQEGLAFLADNATKEGVKTTSSGLQYKVLKDGSGQSPTAQDRVTVNYRGTLLSGKEFDASNDVTFPLNRVIPGWTEGLQLMNEGAKYRLFVPSELAYGERGAGTVIGPNETLIFDVELIKVTK